MMKHEFEERIGKRVDYDTFLMFEAMYNATDLTKDEFCALLNKKAIPESQAATKARAENERYLAAIRDEIEKLDHCIEMCETEQENCLFWAGIYDGERSYWENQAKVAKENMKKYCNRKKALRRLFNI